MFGVILKATNKSFQKGMLFYLSTYMKKVMKLLAFIFEQPAYRRIFAQIYKFLVQKYIFTIFAYELFKVKMKNRI